MNSTQVMSHRGVRFLKVFMSCEGVEIFSEKVYESCWGLFQKWEIS